jgi:hypothetical protein
MRLDMPRSQFFGRNASETSTAQLAVELVLEPAHLGGRVAATVRPALDTELLSAPSPHLHDERSSYERRKEPRWLTMSRSRTAGSTRAGTRR